MNTESVELTKEQEKELMKSARRSIALGILPNMVLAHKNLTPEALVKKAYAIAGELIRQGDVYDEE